MRELALLAVLALLTSLQVRAELIRELDSANGTGIAALTVLLAAVLAFALSFLGFALSFGTKRGSCLRASLHPLLLFSDEFLIMAVAASISVGASSVVAHAPADLGLVVSRLPIRLPAGSLGTAFSEPFRSSFSAKAILTAALAASISFRLHIVGVSGSVSGAIRRNQGPAGRGDRLKLAQHLVRFIPRRGSP